MRVGLEIKSRLPLNCDKVLVKVSLVVYFS